MKRHLIGGPSTKPNMLRCYRCSKFFSMHFRSVKDSFKTASSLFPGPLRCTTSRAACADDCAQMSFHEKQDEYSLATLGSIRDLPKLFEVEQDVPERPTVPSLVALLRSPDENERHDALASLADMVDGAFGEAGAQMGLAMRANGGIALLSWLLADPSPEVQQMVLVVLGNLCSDSVDYDSQATKTLLLQSGGARALLSCVHTENPEVLLFACGALQNLCFEPEWSECAVAHDIHVRLDLLLNHEDAMVVRYASGCLRNITRSLRIDGLSELAVSAVKERTLEYRREGWMKRHARATIARALLEIPSELREARHATGVRRRQRAANLGESDSRPSTSSSSRSSRSGTSSYVTARSSCTSSTVASSSPDPARPSGSAAAAAAAWP